ncbi:MAG: HAD family phosphatase [Candidatus Absconditabacterales bacterium]
MKNEPIKGYIGFDMDDTLADTGVLHWEFQEHILKQYGVHDITRALVSAQFAGVSTHTRIAQILDDRSKTYNKTELIDLISQKNNFIGEKIKNREVQLMPGALITITQLFEDGYRMGISSGSPRELIEAFLTAFDLRRLIPTCTSTYDEGIQGKPAPDVFTNTFDNLDIIYGHETKSPRFIKMGVGDGVKDVISAHQAGADKTFWIPHPIMQDHIAAELKQLQEDGYNPILIKDLKEIHTTISTIL